MKVAFISLTKQTRKFVAKLPYESVEIAQTNPFVEMTEEFVLVVPSYEKDVTEIAWDFMDVNSGLCVGVAGGGNLNFADLFGFTAKDISKDYNVPVLLLFEFQGNENDVNKLVREIKKIEQSRVKG